MADDKRSQSWSWPWPPNPFSLFSAPQDLEQPILSGWRFGNLNVTYQNSSAPDTEQQIVAAQSYGRQLGRIMDAVDCLIGKLAPEQQNEPALANLAKIRIEIEEIKLRAASERVDRIKFDLDVLKASRPEEYEQLVAAFVKPKK